MVALSHVKSLTQADFTGTITAFDSNANTITLAATNIIRPSDWNSGHNFFVTISGNTAGQSTASGTNLVYAGGPFVTLSMNTAAGAATVSFSCLPDGGYLSRYTDFGFEGQSATVNGSNIDNNAAFRVFNLLQPISFTRIDVPVFATIVSAATAATAGAQISSYLVLYTNNASTLSPVIGATGQTTHTWASNSANWSSLTGGKYFSFPIATSLLPGEYFFGWQFSTNTFSSGTASTSLAFSVLLSCQSAANTGSSFTDFGTTASASTNSYFAGLFTNSFTATNQTIALSNISVTGTAQYVANQPIIFRNY